MFCTILFGQSFICRLPAKTILRNYWDILPEERHGDADDAHDEGEVGQHGLRRALERVHQFNIYIRLDSPFI